MKWEIQKRIDYYYKMFQYFKRVGNYIGYQRTFKIFTFFYRF